MEFIRLKPLAMGYTTQQRLSDFVEAKLRLSFSASQSKG